MGIPMQTTMLKTSACLLGFFALVKPSSAFTDATFKDAFQLVVTGPDQSGTNGAHGPISLWDTSQVTDFSNLFVDEASGTGAPIPGADTFNEDITQWDLSSATSMVGMFDYALVFNQDISGWDVSEVTDMTAAFGQAAAFNQDISGWDVSKVTSMRAAFVLSGFNQDISAWDVSSCDVFFMMFGASQFDQALCWLQKMKPDADTTNMFDQASGSLRTDAGCVPAAPQVSPGPTREPTASPTSNPTPVPSSAPSVEPPEETYAVEFVIGMAFAGFGAGLLSAVAFIVFGFHRLFFPDTMSKLGCGGSGTPSAPATKPAGGAPGSLHERSATDVLDDVPGTRLDA